MTDLRIDVTSFVTRTEAAWTPRPPASSATLSIDANLPAGMDASPGTVVQLNMQPEARVSLLERALDAYTMSDAAILQPLFSSFC